MAHTAPSWGCRLLRKIPGGPGLRRLLLGYALPGDGDTLFAGVLPEREVEGGLALTLGKFVEFAEALFAVAEDFAKPRPLAQWTRTLRATLRDVF